MVKIKILNEFGHEGYEGLTVEEAEKMIREKQEEDKYFVFDEATGKIIKHVELTENQSIILLPEIAGG